MTTAVANKHSTRIKVLIYDGFGIWLAVRRLMNKGRFVWTSDHEAIVAWRVRFRQTGFARVLTPTSTTSALSSFTRWRQI
nr:IS66 family insertion sequence element accessory protein TnpB [Paraburkholderia sp. BL8N3]